VALRTNMPPRSFLLGGPQPPPGARSAPVAVAPRRQSWKGGAAAGPAAAAAFLKAAPQSAPRRSASQLRSSGPAAARSLPKVLIPDFPETPPDGYTEDSIDDALDDLLRQAAASLKHLDSIRAKLAPASRPGASKDKRHGVGDFWKPRCRADLWGDDDDEGLWGDLGSETESDDSDSDSPPGLRVEEDELWDFLRNACSAKPAGPANRTATGQASGPSQHGYAKAQQPRPAPKPHSASGEASSRGDERSATGPAERARANGFRFGTYGASSGVGGRPPLPGQCAAGSEAQKPEAQISSALVKAQEDGPSAVRTTLKQLLLRWHPDKAPQGNSPEEVAARAESTRALRFVLQERKRLGL